MTQKSLAKVWQNVSGRTLFGQSERITKTIENLCQVHFIRKFYKEQDETSKKRTVKA